MMMASWSETFSWKEVAHGRQEVERKLKHEKDRLSHQMGNSKVVEKLACFLTSKLVV
jgi:hypothetical protein